MFDLKDKEGIWLKGGLHIHTTDSDGAKSPKEVMRLYRDNGYNFIALTDHWHVNKPTEFEGMQILSGVEYHYSADVVKGVYHIVGLALDKNPKLKKQSGNEACEAQRQIDAIHASGGVAVLAHPAWSLNTPEQIKKLKDIDLTEIYNSVSGEPYNIRAESGNIVDGFSHKYGCCPYLIAADDAHFYKGEHCKAYIMLKAKENTVGEIKKALLNGDFYATIKGPHIDNISVKENRVKIEFKGAKEIWAFSDANDLKQMYNVENKTEFVFDFNENESSYVRFKLYDEKKNPSWSSCIFRKL